MKRSKLSLDGSHLDIQTCCVSLTSEKKPPCYIHATNSNCFYRFNIIFQKERNLIPSLLLDQIKLKSDSEKNLIGDALYSYLHLFWFFKLVNKNINDRKTSVLTPNIRTVQENNRKQYQQLLALLYVFYIYLLKFKCILQSKQRALIHLCTLLSNFITIYSTIVRQIVNGILEF